MMRKNALNIFLALFFGLTAFIVSLAQIQNGHDFMGGDFAQYLLEGIALVNGTLENQIAQNTWIMTTSYRPLAPYHYPWGMALLLAPIYAVFGFHLIAFKFLGIVFYALFVACFYYFCVRENLPRVFAFFATLLFAFNPFLSFFAASHVLSDIPFLCVAFLSIVALSRLFDSSHPSQNPHFYAVFCGSLVALASLIRSNGVVILLTLLAVHFFLIVRFLVHKIPQHIKAKRFFKTLHFLFADFQHLKITCGIFPQISVYIAFALVYFGIDFLLPKAQGSVHWARLTDELTLGTILYHLDLYITCATQFLAVENSGVLMLFLLAAPLTGVGIIQSVAQNAKHIFIVFAWVNQFLLLVIWPPNEGFRFVFILLPFLVFYTAKGIAVFCAQGKKYGIFVAIPLVLIALHFMGNAWVNFKIQWPARQSVYGIFSKEAKETWEFIQKNTPQNAVIISYNPRMVFLMTHRLSFATTNVYRLKDSDFVLVTSYDNMDMMRSDTQEFTSQTRLVFGNENFKLYQIIPSKNPR